MDEKLSRICKCQNKLHEGGLVTFAIKIKIKYFVNW